MQIVRTNLPDVVLLEPTVFADERGWFMETFHDQRLRAALRSVDLPEPDVFVQDNHSCSKAGVVRGLHYQLAPRAQGKLVRVVRGAVFDVAVDLRRASHTFGAWTGTELTEKNRRMLWIPPGFAHGFLALEDDTHFMYKTTDYYAPECERSVAWNDPTIGIDWPLVDISRVIVGAKDAKAPTLSAACDSADVF